MDGLDERQERDEIYVTSTCIGTVYLTLRCWSEENSSVGFQAFAWPGTPTLGLSNSLITVHWLSRFSRCSVPQSCDSFAPHSASFDCRAHCN